MRLTKVIFSYDRPLQLDGLCRSLLDNSDLVPEDIACICRSSNVNYRRAYEQVGEQRGVRIVHENKLIPGVDLRILQTRLNALKRVGWFLNINFHRFMTILPLPQQLAAQTMDTDYVSLAVDDMVYFQKTEFAEATAVLRDNPDIVLWSWRIGKDLQPQPQMEVVKSHWVMRHAGTMIPYNYVFHTDGSVYRRNDLVTWWLKVPQESARTLNQIEGYLWGHYQAQRDELAIGPLHAGPMTQACITWQINRVSQSTTTNFFGKSISEPASLLAKYEGGVRLDYTPLYHRSDWVERLNRGQQNLGWTHVAPTASALETWCSLLQPQATKP